jgi:uncharacterized membrane protein
MLYALLADLIVLLHLLFILFVIAGGVLVLWRPSLAWLHLPCLLWGVFTIVSGSICPLTPWEVEFRLAAGQAPYSGTFIAHYIEPVIYPPGLTRTQQIVFGLLVALINAAVYLRLLLRARHKPMRDLPHG